MNRRADASEDLLYGLLALQNGLIQQSALIGAFGAWTAARERPMADVLADRGALDAPQRVLLAALVDAHLKLHGGDAQRSLAVISPGRSTFASLEALGNDEINASLGHIRGALHVTRAVGAAESTLSYAVGSSTSDGQRFRVLRPHARGGLGAVFVALDTELNREVALKQVLDDHADDPVSRHRFVVEAEITGNLEHPNIVPVYGLGVYGDGRPYYAMRFIRGESLKEAIERFHTVQSLENDPGRRSLSLRKLVRRFTDVCNAVDYAHSRGVLHRDIKPANVILGKYGETLLVDWGLAKPLGEAEPGADRDERALMPRSASGSAETLPGSALGTPGYMSPEQAAGELHRLSPHSDVYSLGATLYCLLTGKPPFQGTDVGWVLRAVQEGDFPPPRRLNASLDRALEAVCMKAMAKAPADRYPSARALADDLEHWMADEPVVARPEPALTRLARWGRRHKSSVAAAIALLGTAVVALAIGAALLNSANAQTQRERDLARQNFDTARHAVNDYLTRVGRNPVLKEQGLHDLRQELLEAALHYYQDFLRQQGEAPDVRAAAADAYGRVGDIHREQGRFNEAIAAYDRALSLVPDSSNSIRAALARLSMETSRITALTPLGRFDEGIAAYERASASQTHDGAAEFGAALLALCNAGADAYTRSGRANDGLQASQHALAAGEPYCRQHPEDVVALHDLTVAYMNTTRGLTLSSQGEEAMRVGKRGVELAETFLGGHPRDIELREALAELIENFAFLEKLRSHDVEALAHLRRAVTLLEDLCRENRLLFRPRLILSQALALLSSFESDYGKPIEARRSADRAVAVADELQTQSPSLPRVRENAGVCHLALGRALLQSGEPARALAPLLRAAELMEKSGERSYLYNAACALSLASSIDDSAQPGSPADRQGRQARAVDLLKKAVDHGLSEPAILQNDVDLVPIKSREDFRALIRAMESAAGPKIHPAPEPPNK